MTNETTKRAPKLSPKSVALKASILERLKAHDAAVRSKSDARPDKKDDVVNE